MGADLNHYMEKMVSDSDRVICICTPGYKQRVDDRVGGAGYEATLISAEIVRRHGTIKFVPILRKGDWETAVPRCLMGRNGLDMQDDSKFDEQFSNLIEDLRRDSGLTQAKTQGSAGTLSDDLPILTQDRGRSPSSLPSKLAGEAKVKQALTALAAQGQQYFRLVGWKRSEIMKRTTTP